MFFGGYDTGRDCLKRMKSFLQLNLQVLNPRRDLSITRYRLILATLLVLILAIVVLFRLYVLQVMSEAWRQLNELALDEIAESMRDEVLILLQPVSEQNPENMALRQLIKDVRGLSAGG